MRMEWPLAIAGSMLFAFSLVEWPEGFLDGWTSANVVGNYLLIQTPSSRIFCASPTYQSERRIVGTARSSKGLPCSQLVWS